MQKKFVEFISFFIIDTFYNLVPDSDLSPFVSDSAPSPITRDFIGLCIGILSVVIVILTVAICKWSRCQCLNANHHDNDQTESLTSVIDHNTAPVVRRPSRQRSSSCDRLDNDQSNRNRTRDGLLSSPQRTYNGTAPARDIKVPRVTITALSVQPSQQMVPRLSISPQVSNSSTTQSTYSIKQ